MAAGARGRDSRRPAHFVLAPHPEYQRRWVPSGQHRGAPQYLRVPCGATLTELGVVCVWFVYGCVFLPTSARNFAGTPPRAGWFACGCVCRPPMPRDLCVVACARTSVNPWTSKAWQTA